MKYKLSDLTVDGKGTYGIAASAVDYDSQKPTYLRITDINDDGTINFDGLKSVDDENSYKYILKENDIVFARTGASTGRSYFYQKEDGVFVYAGFLIKFSLDPKKVNPRYLKYYTHSKIYYDWVHSFDSGATRGNINAKTFGDMLLDLPERNVQDKIVSILKEIDSKIAVNRRICENLEAQAQALFKHWFIDFAPFKNGQFVESELGMIPEGWRVGTLGDLGKIICGKTPSKSNKSYYGDDVPFIKIPDMHGNVFILKSEDNLSIEGSNSQSSKLIPEFSIMVSCIATVGLVAMNIKPSHTNQQINTIVPCQSCYRYYVYENLKLRYKELQVLGSSGTTTYNVNTRTFSSLKIIVPELWVIEDFNNVIKFHFEKILNLYQENLRLSTLRDTLLPKLMSGQIKV